MNGAVTLNTSPKTADKLRAFVDKAICGLSPKEKRRFWQIMQDHPDNSAFREFVSTYSEINHSLLDLLHDTATNAVALGNDAVGFQKQLQKHRKPVRNAERDAEIMRLNAEGKTGGQIAIALSGKWKLKSSTVRRVISREIKKSSSADAYALAQKQTH